MFHECFNKCYTELGMRFQTLIISIGLMKYQKIQCCNVMMHCQIHNQRDNMC